MSKQNMTTRTSKQLTSDELRASAIAYQVYEWKSGWAPIYSAHENSLYLQSRPFAVPERFTKQVRGKRDLYLVVRKHKNRSLDYTLQPNDSFAVTKKPGAPMTFGAKTLGQWILDRAITRTVNWERF